MPKPFGEHRPRQTGLPRQLGNPPRMRVLIVKKCQRPANFHISCTHEPSGLVFRQFVNVRRSVSAKNTSDSFVSIALAPASRFAAWATANFNEFSSHTPDRSSRMLILMSGGVRA